MRPPTVPSTVGGWRGQKSSSDSVSAQRSLGTVRSYSVLFSVVGCFVMTAGLEQVQISEQGHKMEAKTGTQDCAGCGKPISERYMLKALDLYWHEDCLKCGCCDCRLGEVGSTLYTKANLILCRRDYLRLFGSTGYCSACSKVIPAFEMVMRARTNVYHLECFACQQCNHRFCVGDRFYLCDNKILCEYDYEERLVFANMAYNPNQLAQLKRQANGQIPSPSLGPTPVRSIGSGDLNNNMSQQQSVLKAPTS